MNKKYFVIFLVAILLIGAIPRSIEVLAGNYLFGFDQGLFFQDVKKIVVDHKLTLIGSFTGGQGGLFQGPGWYYLLSIPFFLTNGDPMAAMVLMIIIGLSTVLFSIYFGSKMFGNTTGILIGFLISISPAIIAQSRFIWPPFPISLLTVFFLFFLYKTLRRDGQYFPLATFTVGIMSHFELATAGTIILQIFLLSPLLLFKKILSFRFWVISIFSFLLTLAPLIIFNFRHDDIIFKGISNMLPKGGASEHQVTLKYIEHMFLNHLDVFRLNFLSSFYTSNFLQPIILAILVIGVALYLKDAKVNLARKLFILYLLTSPVSLFLVFMFYLWPMWQWWILQLIIYYNFAFAVLSVYLWKKIILRPFIVSMCIIFFVAFTTQVVNFYKNDLNDYGGTHKIKGKIDALDYIYKDAKGEKFGLLVFTPPIYTYAYDYLLWWHGERNYGYIPYNDKKGAFYLLIEPDPHKPWSYKGWLETVIKTGKIIKRHELPSGFIIEKRIIENEKI